MKDDPIVAEVRRVREAHAARFNYNLRAIYEDIKKQEQGCAQELHRLPAICTAAQPRALLCCSR